MKTVEDYEQIRKAFLSKGWVYGESPLVEGRPATPQKAHTTLAAIDSENLHKPKVCQAIERLWSEPRQKFRRAQNL